MSGYRSRRTRVVKDINEFEPVSEEGLYNIQDGINAMVSSFEAEVMREIGAHGIEFPIPVSAVRSTLCKWEGVCSESMCAALGDLAYDDGYEVSIEIFVDYTDKDKWFYWDLEENIATMIENTTYLTEMMKSFECTLDVCILPLSTKQESDYTDP